MSTMYPSTKAAITALTELGFRHRTTMVKGISQFRDFRTMPVLNKHGERIANVLVLYTRDAEDRFMEISDQFVKRTAELGAEWTVETIPGTNRLSAWF